MSKVEFKCPKCGAEIEISFKSGQNATINYCLKCGKPTN